MKSKELAFTFLEKVAEAQKDTPQKIRRKRVKRGVKKEGFVSEWKRV